jgi:CubicO group peptidase (beta-lactamase class C family)
MHRRPAFLTIISNFIIIIVMVFCLFGQSAALQAAEPEEISGRVSKLMAVENIPGAAVFVIHKGVPVYERAFGYADIKSKTKFDFAKTVFAAGSLSKIITAVAALKLSENKRVALDSPVTGCLAGMNGPSKLSRLPIFKKAGNVTPMSLLTHSSGFANCADLYAKKPAASVSASVYVTAAAADSASPKLFDFIAKNVPRLTSKNINTKFEYSNFNYALLGHLIEESENISFDEYIKNNILLPLKMNYSSFSHANLSKSLEESCYEVNFAAGYDFSDGEFSESAYREHNMPPASGLLTSAADMKILASMLVSLCACAVSSSTLSVSAGPVNVYLASSNMPFIPAVIGVETAGSLFKPRLPVKKSEASLLDAFPPIDSMAAGFRHSLFRGRDIFWHTGSVKGYTCGLYIAPQTSSAFFIACNSSNPAFRQKLIKYLLDGFYGRK